MVEADPPAYEPAPGHFTRRHRLSARRSSSLPPRANREPAQHEFALKNGKNRQWATLKLFTSTPATTGTYDARAGIQLPTFYEDEPISGTLEIEEDKLNHVDAINISVKGSIITGVSTEAFVFLDMPRVLWIKPMGEPTKSDGRFSFPFSINLPKDVAITSKPTDTPRTYRIPPTISERHTKCTTQYELTVHIRRRGVLRPDSRIGTALGYIPIIKPSPPSRLRQSAYETNTPLVGPEGDAEGWETLPPTKFHGKVSNDRIIQSSFKLSLARPLSYTRGSTLPLTMALSCEDSDALDLLSKPNSIFARLRRQVSYTAGGPTISKISGSDYKDEFQDYDLAAWWPSLDRRLSEKGREDPRVRYIDGEIRLANDLIPSSAIAHFAISYSVVVFPFDALAFAAMDTQPLLTVPVEIGTTLPRGPRPLSYAPQSILGASVRREPAVTPARNHLDISSHGFL
ncbi:hypothetical protein PLICRDRAFT_45212 [Plicaturopsis crispa FD-325 SS-3]|uniref:Arrestin-like N-terminal domain-containing protein n=1 Tax=Plicaturopsis crispa FD-325 SS-3 TaxID=944288 RepID=A0A0C9T9Y6_PLICR|nr:hypothetical protein PLICRDRAFT_45212 [Plicaturopsis crispa FD-325 SS-3]